MLSGIKEMAAAYDTVQLRWIRSHTNGSSLAELGNSRADNFNTMVQPFLHTPVKLSLCPETGPVADC